MQTKNYSNPFRIRIFLFPSYLIWNWNDKYVHTLPQFPRKPYPIPYQNGQSVYRFSDQNGAKTLPDGAAHTYIAYIKEYPPSPGSRGKGKPCVTTVKIWFCLEKFSGKLHLPINWSICKRPQHRYVKQTHKYSSSHVCHSQTFCRPLLPCKSTAKEVSFEWSHYSISFTVSKFRIIQDSEPNGWMYKMTDFHSLSECCEHHGMTMLDNISAISYRQMKKGNKISQFLQKCIEQLRKDFTEFR